MKITIINTDRNEVCFAADEEYKRMAAEVVCYAKQVVLVSLRTSFSH